MKKILVIFLFIGSIFSSSFVKIISYKGRIKSLNNGKTSVITKRSKIDINSSLKLFNSSSIKLLYNGKKINIIGPKLVNLKKIFGLKSTSSILNLFLKIKTKDNISSVPTTITGVRGAEKGKKNAFGVMWKKTDSKKKDNNYFILFDRGKKYFDNKNYEKAILEFKEFIKSSGKNKKVIDANLYIALAYIQQIDFENALKYLNNIDESKINEKLKESVYYYKAQSNIMLTRYDTSYEYISKYLKNYQNGKYIWNIKVLKIYYLINKKKIKDAGKLKEHILLNSNDTEIKDLLQSIDLDSY